MNKLPAGLSRDLEERKKGGSQHPQSRSSREKEGRQPAASVESFRREKGKKVARREGKKSREERRERRVVRREKLYFRFLKKNLFFLKKP